LRVEVGEMASENGVGILHLSYPRFLSVPKTRVEEGNLNSIEFLRGVKIA
jgi:hypothetical protein